MNIGSEQKRDDGRSDNQLRPIRITAGINSYAEGSADVHLGNTKLLITASVDRISTSNQEESGQIFSTLSMLPRSMHIRIREQQLADAVKQELVSLQNLVSRSLRGAIPSELMANIAVTLDCVIVFSDSGIATAAIAGAWTAFYQALRWAAQNKLVKDDIYVKRVGSIAAAINGTRFLIDPCAKEASASEFTLNFVFDENTKLVDLRGSLEKESADMSSYLAALSAASKQVSSIFQEQERAILEAGK